MKITIYHHFFLNLSDAVPTEGKNNGKRETIKRLEQYFVMKHFIFFTSLLLLCLNGMARAELPSFFTPSADTEESRKLNEKNAKTRRAIKGLLRQKRNLAVSQGKGSSGKGLAFGKSSSSGKGIGSSGNFTGSSGKGTYSSGKGTYSSGKGTYSSGKGTYSSGKGSYSSGKGSSSSGKGSSSFEDDAFVDDSVFSDITFILVSCDKCMLRIYE